MIREKIEMTKLEIIKEIGDRLTNLDVLLGNFDDPDSSTAINIRKQRFHLDMRQRKLVTALIDENDPGYADAAFNINKENEVLKKTILKIEKAVETIETVKRLVVAMDKLLGLIL